MRNGDETSRRAAPYKDESFLLEYLKIFERFVLLELNIPILVL